MKTLYHESEVVLPAYSLSMKSGSLVTEPTRMLLFFFLTLSFSEHRYCSTHKYAMQASKVLFGHVS